MSEDETLDDKLLKRRKETLQAAQISSILSRTEPDIYDYIKKYAEENGLTVNQAIAQLVKKQIVIQNIALNSMTAEQLMMAFDILKDFMHYAASTYTEVAKIFFSDLTEAYSKMLEEKLKEIEEKKQQKSEVGGKLINKMLDIIEPMIEYTISQAFKPMGIPNTLKTKIPVKLNLGDNVVDNRAENSSGLEGNK
ncbi:MAG: hypothetical protein QXV17_10440 [Candidatus Micrarchaeaceae archaeon]